MAFQPSFGCQDTQYSQSSQSSGGPQSHRLCTTYDPPSSFIIERACSTSRRISLQHLHSRAKMYLKDNITIERSCSSASRISHSSIKRSVLGMKTLLPLKLLSPTLLDFETWPSEPSKRSTFGMRIASQDFEQSSDIGERARDSLRSKKRSRQYRDTPIYSQPGSPIPSRAYYSDDDVCFDNSHPGSICDEYGIIQSSASFRDCDTEGEEDDEDNSEQTPCAVKTSSKRPSVVPTPRWSELSFQCSGEAMYENESDWLRSLMSMNNSTDDPMLAVDMVNDDSAERTVETWLSDTTSNFEHEEVLACATSLSPSKAQVIDLRVNTNHLSDLSIRIPARSSSLKGTSILENNFWDTFGTPPVTPCGTGDQDLDLLPQGPFLEKKINLKLPKRRLDPAIASPPLSPPLPSTVPLTKHDKTPASVQNLDNQWSGSFSNLSQNPLADIISSLEASTGSFPSSILLPDSPCIVAIRSQYTHPLSHSSMCQEANLATPLKSPFGQDFPRPPSYQPIMMTPTYSGHHGDISHSSSCNLLRNHNSSTMRVSSSPVSAPSTCLYLPDLSPMYKIFPKTSDFMRSALYAHIIAHIFVTSLSPSVHNGRTNPISGRCHGLSQRTSSLVSPKDANVLGIPPQDPSSSHNDTWKHPQFKTRIQALQQTIRKCIYCLISVMDSNIGIEDIAELEDNGPGFSNGKLFMRMLEEVVRGCESRNNNSGMI